MEVNLTASQSALSQDRNHITFESRALPYGRGSIRFASKSFDRRDGPLPQSMPFSPHQARHPDANVNRIFRISPNRPQLSPAVAVGIRILPDSCLFAAIHPRQSRGRWRISGEITARARTNSCGLAAISIFQSRPGSPPHAGPSFPADPTTAPPSRPTPDTRAPAAEKSAHRYHAENDQPDDSRNGARHRRQAQHADDNARRIEIWIAAADGAARDPDQAMVNMIAV